MPSITVIHKNLINLVGKPANPHLICGRGKQGTWRENDLGNSKLSFRLEMQATSGGHKIKCVAIYVCRSSAIFV